MFLAKIETSFVFDFAFKGLFLVLWLFKRYFNFYSFQGCGRGVLGVVLVDLCQGFGRFLSFLKNILQNIWRLHGKSIPLHSLYKTSHLASYLKQ